MIKEESLTLNADGAVIRFSQSLEDSLGFSAYEVLGRHFSSLACNGDGPELSALITKAAQSQTHLEKSIRLKRRDGSVAAMFASVYPMRDATGRLYSFMITLNAGKPLQAPAILSEEFQRIFKFSNDAVAVTDRTGAIMDVNQAFLDTYGYAREEVLGKNPRVLKSGHSTKELYERMWGDILDPKKGFWRGEIINLRKDGSEVPVILSINAIKDSSGDISNFLGIAFDMTRQKELDRLNRMYIDYIVHDMRGPITTIMANSEILMMQLEGTLPEKTRRKLEMILESAQALTSMTSDMLDFSRSRAGGLKLRRQRMEVGRIVRDASRPFVSHSKRLYINGVPSAVAELPEAFVEADSDKLLRVIYNLLGNAFKHASSEVRLAVAMDGGELTVTITDDGKGFGAGEAEKIFDAFYQTEDGIKTGGAGLGLSIVKSFVEAHGGSVWAVPSEEGRGATFGFVIPSGG